MKLAKKTISVALAGIMAVSSLAVGTSVFAADVKAEELKSSTKATATVKCDVKAGVETKDVYEKTVKLYSFKPSTNGLYDVKLAQNAYVLTADAYQNSADPAPVFEKGDRLDNASMVMFTADDADEASTIAKNFKANEKNAVASAVVDTTAKAVQFYKDENATKKSNHAKDYVAGSYSHVATGYTATDGLTYTYLDRTAQVNLDKTKTYYIAVVNDPFDYYKKDPYAERVIGERVDGAQKDAIFTISKADWKYTDATTVQPVSGTTMTYKVLKTAVEYVGDSNTIVMPDEYPANYKAVEIRGEADKNVTSVKLGKNCEIMNLNVSNRKKLVSFTYNDLIKEIGDGVFFGCSALKSIVIPKSIKKIGNNAFANCTRLASITLNEGLEKIGDRAFFNNVTLAVKVPSTVTEIGSQAFGYILSDNEFYKDDYNHRYVIVNPSFVLGGTSDYVMNWAKKNDIPYVDLKNGCSHHYVTYVKVAPTFFTTGSEVKECGFCGVSTKTVLPKTKPVIKAVKSTGKGKIKVYANKTAGVSGYQIKVSTSKKFTKKTTKVVTVKERDRLLKTVKGLKRGKKVYVKIRAYKKSGSKKTYSAFSPVKTVKVK